MRNYELTFLFECVFDNVPMKPFEKMIVREVAMKDDVIELINSNAAVITKIID